MCEIIDKKSVILEDGVRINTETWEEISDPYKSHIVEEFSNQMCIIFSNDTKEMSWNIIWWNSNEGTSWTASKEETKGIVIHIDREEEEQWLRPDYTWGPYDSYK